jgi:putative transposase
MTIKDVQNTRRVHVLGITLHPTDEWIANVLRTATADGAPLGGRKHWRLDNDGKYGQRTTPVLGKRALWTSVRAPDINCVIER